MSLPVTIVITKSQCVGAGTILGPMTSFRGSQTISPATVGMTPPKITGHRSGHTIIVHHKFAGETIKTINTGRRVSVRDLTH